MYSLDSSQFLGKLLTLSSVYGLLAGAGKFLNNGRVVPKIDLGTNNEAWNAFCKTISKSKPFKLEEGRKLTRTMVMNFGEPLLLHVFEGSRAGNAETNQENIGLRIAEGTETIIVFLSRSIKQAQGVGFVTNPVLRLEYCSYKNGE